MLNNANNENNIYLNSDSLSILVVDDDPDMVTMVEQASYKHRLRVSAFTDPVMALEDFKINCKTCSLILSDIRMPGINGYEFVKKIKEIDNQVRIILMTAFGIEDKEFYNILPDIKVDGFLQKPFSIQQLNDVIEVNQ
jgi:DNA-binding NtrC family response regulator